VFADELCALSSALTASESTAVAAASERYQLLQKVYGHLESGWALIQRRLLPGPRMYNSVEAFTADISALRSGFDSHTSAITASDQVCVSLLSLSLSLSLLIS
jgi:hypothetical protein